MQKLTLISYSDYTTGICYYLLNVIYFLNLETRVHKVTTFDILSYIFPESFVGLYLVAVSII